MSKYKLLQNAKLPIKNGQKQTVYVIYNAGHILEIENLENDKYLKTLIDNKILEKVNDEIKKEESILKENKNKKEFTV